MSEQRRRRKISGRGVILAALLAGAALVVIALFALAANPDASIGSTTAGVLMQDAFRTSTAMAQDFATGLAQATEADQATQHATNAAETAAAQLTAPAAAETESTQVVAIPPTPTRGTTDFATLTPTPEPGVSRTATAAPGVFPTQAQTQVASAPTLMRTSLPPTAPPRTPAPTQARSATPAPTRTVARAASPTPAPTMTRASTLTATPLVVAGLPPQVVEQNLVVDISGALVGYGTLRLFAPSSITAPEPVRVELEITILQREIMPTPITINGTPVAQVTATPPPTQPSPTPRNQVTQKEGQLIYQRMGAALYCPGAPFDGCSASGTRDIQSIGDNERLWWYWDLAPRAGVSGPQRLTAELWRLEQIEGVDTSEREWSHTFTITVEQAVPVVAAAPRADDGGTDWVPIAGAGIIVALLAVIIAPVLVRAWRRRGRPHPTIFISYRRKTGWATARAVRDRLAALGANVFIDVEDINEGRFAEVIEQAIRGADHVVVVLAPGTLDSHWVQLEIETAITYGVNIIPVLDGGFRFEDVVLPEPISALTRYNAVRLEPEFFEAAINRLAVFTRLKQA